MFKPFALVTLVALTTFAACGGDDSTPSPAATGGTGGGGGSSAGGGASCEEGDTGTLTIEVDGLGYGANPKATLSGPDGDTAIDDATSDDVATGEYTLLAERVADQDPIVRKLWDPDPEEQAFCVSTEETTVSLNYELIPPSNKLWVVSGADDELAAFSSERLGESDPGDATVRVNGPGSNDLAFDRDGNLWAFGPTTEDAPLARFAAADLGNSGDKEPDREIVVNDIACIPALRAMAFDPDGNLWLSVCGGEVVRLTPDMLESDEATPDVVISGLGDNSDLAFDSDGNLWVANDGTVVRFDANRLDESTSDEPDATISVRNSADDAGVGATFLTFDGDGDLWVTDFGGNTLAELSAADLSDDGEATVVSNVSLVLSVTALLNRPAFDDAGALWISYEVGTLAKLDPGTLEVSTDAGDPTPPDLVLESDDVGSVGNVAFFPAAEDLPLYSSFP
jgi:sugar lactone lactonase YvrE